MRRIVAGKNISGRPPVFLGGRQMLHFLVFDKDEVSEASSTVFVSGLSAGSAPQTPLIQECGRSNEEIRLFYATTCSTKVIEPWPEPQYTEQWPAKSPVLLGVNATSAVSPALTFILMPRS